MTSERRIRTSSRERAYRAEHSHDIKVARDSQVICTSCGKKIYVNIGKLYTHPLIGTLQCEECWNYFDDIEFTSDEEGDDKYCRICGHHKPLVICKKEECHLGFCKKCIERSTSSSVQNIKLKKWKCFVCCPEPLWELRAICAAVMDSVSKRGNRKKSSRSNANYSDDNVLPHIKQQFARTRKTQKFLQSICDEEPDDDDDDVSVKRMSLPIITNKGNHTKQLDNKSMYERRKRRNSDKRINPLNKKHHQKSSTHLDKQEIDSDIRSDDNSDTSVTNYPIAKKDRTQLVHKKPLNVSVKESSNTSHKNNSTKGPERLLKRNAKSQQKKLQHPTYNKSASDSDDSIYVIKRSSRFCTNKKNDNEDSDINNQSDEEEEEEEARRQTLHRARNSSRKENSLSHGAVQHGMKNQTCKNVTTMRRSGTESSSGKEFRKSKLCHTSSKSLKSLKTSSEIDQDYTKLGSDTLGLAKKAGGKVIGKEESNIMKSYVNKKLGEIQDTTVLALTQLKHKNGEKEILNQQNMYEILFKSERTIEKLRDIMDKTWSDVLLFYKAWCKKHGLTEKTLSVITENETSQKEQNVEKNVSHTSDEIRIGGDSIVSDCDSEEIFSADESRRLGESKNKDSDNQESDVGSNWISVRSKSESQIKLTDNTTDEEPDAGNTTGKIADPCSLQSSPVLQNHSEENVEEDRMSPVLGTVKNKKDFNKAEDSNNLRTKKSKSPACEDNDLPENKKNESSKDNENTKNLETEIYPSTSNITDTSLNDIFENSEEIASVANSTRVETTENANTTSKEIDTEADNDTQESEVVENSLNESAKGDKKKQKPLDTKNNRTKSSDNDSIDLSINKVVDDESSKVSIETSVKRGRDSTTDGNTSAKEKLLEENNSQSDGDIHSDSTVLVTHTPKDNEDTSEKIPEDDDFLGNNSGEECSDMETEEAAKRALLFSDTDVSVECEADNDEEKAKRSLLTSSESESSLSLKSLNLLSDSDIDSGSKNSLKRSRAVESDTSMITRSKRKKFKLDRNHHFSNDEKLQMVCEVRLARLPGRVLRKYKKALEKSRRNVESKTMKSLVDLDNLERCRKKRANDDSINDDNNEPSSTARELKRKTRSNKNDKDTMPDIVEQVENGDPLCSPSESFEATGSKGLERPDSALIENEALLSWVNDDADKLAKQLLLAASDSSAEEEAAQAESSNNDKTVKKKIKKEKSNESDVNSDSTKKSDKENEVSSSDEKVKKEKSWREDKLLTLKFSDSDSEKEEEKWSKSQENQQSKDVDNSDEQKKKRKKKKKGARRIFDSDSDKKSSDSSSDTDSSVTIFESTKNSSDSDKTMKKKRHKRRKSSDSDTSFTEKRSKPKRKRIKQPVTDSDSGSETLSNSQGSPNKSGRKNIRKVIKDKQVADDTKQAAKEEEDRLKRIAERQKLYNEIYETKLANEEKVEKLILDFDPETKKELVTVHEGLVKRLKPHQAKGIKFMWDACFESVERIKTSKGSGCILAHCMGLGKTLQVITLTHTLLTHEETGIKTVMVVCPLSTVLNWVNEYKTWLKNVDDADDINVYELTRDKKNYERMYKLQDWQRNGGVLIIGYEMFRNLSNATKKMRKSMRESILKSLVDPGADLVVCDEGHLLKNEDTALSKCMRQVKTLRRVVLTGTPLQNNLKEYHCMVQFVKPNLLGTKKEFCNRFVQPIINGQFDNSTPHDVKLMKKRAHVLHKMLEGSVQRFDYAVLTPFLPPKQEYVIFVRLTDVQIRLYQYYLDNFARIQHEVGRSLFADFQELQRIWTHPIVLHLNSQKVEKNERKRYSSDSEGSLKNFIDDGSDSDIRSTSCDSDVQSVDSSEQPATKRSTRNNPTVDEPEPVVKEEEPRAEWWSQFVQPEHFLDLRISAKLVLLFEILKQSNHIGDKVLVFSQSLYSLTLIEEFLSRIDDETQSGKTSEYLEGHTGNWVLGADYFRLDGQTSAENRSIWCKEFNKPSNTRARLFLISTRAGGLGINLTAANRVIIFDASWNPSHDVQSIFRIYRFGQKKPCYVYRLLAYGTMEQKIYNRQVTKLSLSCRVVDEQQIERHYSNASLNELYSFETPVDEERTFQLPKDRLLADILLKYKKMIENYHEHDSLLENRAEEELDEEDRKQAWLEYEEEKKGRPVMPPMVSNDLFMLQHANMMQAINMPSNMNQIQNMNMRIEFEKLQQLIRKDYPNMTPELQAIITQKSLSGMYNYMERQVGYPTQQMPYGVNMVNSHNNMPSNVQQSASANNARNFTILQNQLISGAMQQQAQQRNNYDSRIVNLSKTPQNVVAGAVITVEDTEMPTSSKNAQASAQTPGNSKDQEE